jgi:hypothetical protein
LFVAEEMNRRRITQPQFLKESGLKLYFSQSAVSRFLIQKEIAAHRRGDLFRYKTQRCTS